MKKISLSTTAIENPSILEEIAMEIGSQSLAVVMDIKYCKIDDYEIFLKNGSINTHKKIAETIKYFENLGVGELIINSIDNDGMMKGYDLNLIDSVLKYSSVPVTFVGGAGHLDHIAEVIKKRRFIGIAAGGLFVFKGKYNAVLINYPSEDEKNKLYS